MLQDGIFDEYKPEFILGQHVSVDFPVGTMAFLPGTIMASADEIHLTIHGKGGHGALPHLCNDTVLAASLTVVALLQVRSRLCHPLTPMVLTFGKLIADGATNIIPSEVKLSGTFRTVDETWRSEGLKHIRRIITETCAASGCSVPTLYRQYTDLCEPGGARFLAFGVDPDFSDSIDGLIEVDLQAIRPKKRKRYLGEAVAVA